MYVYIYIYITQLVIWHVFKGNLEWNLEIRKLVWISKWATQHVKQWKHWLVLHVNQTINGWLLVRKAVIYTRLLYADCQTSFMIAIYDTCLSQGASVFTVTSLWFPAPLRSECCHKFDSELWRRSCWMFEALPRRSPVNRIKTGSGLCQILHYSHMRYSWVDPSCPAHLKTKMIRAI